jgi:hypothetical protein
MSISWAKIREPEGVMGGTQRGGEVLPHTVSREGFRGESNVHPDNQTTGDPSYQQFASRNIGEIILLAILDIPKQN